MNAPLMPKATAVWLIENTTLTFEQIAEFCKMHPLEVKGIADGEVAVGIIGEDPIANEQLSKAEIKRCELDPKASLKLSEHAQEHLRINVKKRKTAHYTPIAKRQDKPDAVYWFTRFYPNVTDQQIVKLIGTTKTTIAAIKGRTHWNMNNIKPRDPVLLGLCSQTELDKVLEKAKLNPDVTIEEHEHI